MPNLFILNVGHGNCSILLDKHGVVVIDAGKGDSLKKFLLARNITAIDVLLLSHSDSDHIRGAIDILENGLIDIKFIRFNSDIRISNRDTFIRLLRLINDISRRQEINGDSKIDCDASLTSNLNGKINKGEVNVEVLAPSIIIAGLGAGSIDPSGNPIKTNSISAVIRLSYKGVNKVLLPGDIDIYGLTNLRNENKDNEYFNLQANIIVYPHHGGKSNGEVYGSDKYDLLEKNFVKELLELTKPENIIFSAGDCQNFPNATVLAEVMAINSEVGIYSIGDSPNVKKIESEKVKNKVGTIHIDLLNDKINLEISK